jgi:hypothetical protein
MTSLVGCHENNTGPIQAGIEAGLLPGGRAIQIRNSYRIKYVGLRLYYTHPIDKKH